jgi:hypothetical protein
MRWYLERHFQTLVSMFNTLADAIRACRTYVDEPERTARYFQNGVRVLARALDDVDAASRRYAAAQALDPHSTRVANHLVDPNAGRLDAAMEAAHSAAARVIETSTTPPWGNGHPAGRHAAPLAAASAVLLLLRNRVEDALSSIDRCAVVYEALVLRSEGVLFRRLCVRTPVWSPTHSQAAWSTSRSTSPLSPLTHEGCEPLMAYLRTTRAAGGAGVVDGAAAVTSGDAATTDRSPVRRIGGVITTTPSVALRKLSDGAPTAEGAKERTAAERDAVMRLMEAVGGAAAGNPAQCLQRIDGRTLFPTPIS